MPPIQAREEDFGGRTTADERGRRGRSSGGSSSEVERFGTPAQLNMRRGIPSQLPRGSLGRHHTQRGGPAAFLRCGSRFSGSLSGTEP